MPVTIYHNPRCSKSRQTLNLLEEQGITPKVIEYLQNPPTTKELKHILNLLGMEPRQLLRKNEAAYKDAGLDDPALSDDELISLMVKNPVVIERPIIINDGKAVIGRPPENILKIL